MKNRTRNYILKISSRKVLALILVSALLLGMLPSDAIPAASAAEKAGYGVSNPTTDSEGVTTWDCVYFGNYWQNDTNNDGKADKNDAKEPVKWRVLSVNGDDAFLLADQNLDCQKYNDTYVSVTWETCTMRSWLNGYGAGSNVCEKDYTSDNFLDNAFSSGEQAAIRNTNVVNADNPNTTEGGNDTMDKVYLLSCDEVLNSGYGFTSTIRDAETREIRNTAYVSMANVGRGAKWWLRSPGLNSRSASCVSYHGFVEQSGSGVNDDFTYGVVPALHLNLSSTSGWSYAGKVSSKGGEKPKPTLTPAAPEPTLYDFKVNYVGEDTQEAKKKKGTIPVKFDEAELKNSSKEYNHNIARFCSVLSTLAYDIQDGYEDTLKKMGYDYDSMVLDKNGDSICYGLANKRIYLDGKETDVVLVVLRGTYNMEWVDNFNPGMGKTHKGFQKGADTAYQALKKYVDDKKIGKDGRKTKVIMTGHSRGAAVANLLGKDIIDKGGSFLADSGDLFDYSFATPNSTSSAERKNAKYNGIFSIVNPEDFVTKVMISKNWGYGRYGRTLILPSSSTDNKKSYASYLGKMQDEFHVYRPYDNYKPYPDGMNAVSNYVNLVAWTVPNVSSYYMQPLGVGYYASGASGLGTLKNCIHAFWGITSAGTQHMRKHLILLCFMLR